MDKFGIKHFLYGYMTAIVGEFCFFQMGLTHERHTTPLEFVDEKQAQKTLDSIYPDDDNFRVELIS